MKTTRPYPRLIITKKGTRWTETGHPWIYEGEVIRAELPDGTEIVLPLRVTGEDSNASMGTTLPLCPIENGAIVRPVTLIVLAGNFLQMMNDVAEVGNDLKFRGSIGCPSVKFNRVSVSG